VVKRDHDLMTILTYVSMGYGIGVMPQTMTRMNIPNVVFRGDSDKLSAEIRHRLCLSPQRFLAANRSLDQAHAQPCAAALTADLRIRYSLTPVIVRQMCDA
jgi:hypothetical protein